MKPPRGGVVLGEAGSSESPAVGTPLWRTQERDKPEQLSVGRCCSMLAFQHSREPQAVLETVYPRTKEKSFSVLQLTKPNIGPAGKGEISTTFSSTITKKTRKSRFGARGKKLITDTNHQVTKNLGDTEIY